jgi:hypothetical protein
MPFDGTQCQNTELAMINHVIDLLSDPRGWTQGADKRLIKHRNGGPTHAYCVLGATLDTKRVGREDAEPVSGWTKGYEGDHYVNLTKRLCSAYHCRSLVDFNDLPTTTHAMIMDGLFKVRAELENACV